jgi:hypothetical protein
MASKIPRFSLEGEFFEPLQCAALDKSTFGFTMYCELFGGYKSGIYDSFFFWYDPKCINNMNRETDHLRSCI